MYRIIGADGKEYGPITAEQLRQWIAEGRANAQTRVLPEGTTEWKTLAELPEFISPPPGTVSSPPPMSSVPVTSPAALDQVSGPSTALIILAILGFLLQGVGLMFSFMPKTMFPGGQMPEGAWGQMMSGGTQIISAIVGVLINLLVLMGGLKMKRLQSYGLAMTASILVMLPCSLSICCIIGLPIGIWSIVVLSRPEVKNAFT